MGNGPICVFVAVMIPKPTSHKVEPLITLKIMIQTILILFKNILELTNIT